MSSKNHKNKNYTNAAIQRIHDLSDGSADAPSHDFMLNVVMVEPEMPANTGNVSRTCAITGAKMHLVKPLGFSIEDKMLKRAGLDYWDKLDIEVHDSLDAFLEKYGDQPLFLATTHGGVCYTEAEYPPGAFILFGPETRGLPKDLIAANPDTSVRIPMGKDPALRSLNLSNSVAIMVYEVLRQHGFPGLL